MYGFLNFFYSNVLFSMLLLLHITTLDNVFFFLFLLGHLITFDIDSRSLLLHTFVNFQRENKVELICKRLKRIRLLLHDDKSPTHSSPALVASAHFLLISALSLNCNIKDSCPRL